MKIKRALLASIYTYLASLIIGIIGAFIFSADPAQASVPVPMFLIGILAPILFAWIFATWYFRGSRVVQGRGQGFALGILMVLIGFILDIVTVLPTAGGSLGNTVALLTDYYTQVVFWVTALLVIGACVVVGGNTRPQQIEQ